MELGRDEGRRHPVDVGDELARGDRLPVSPTDGDPGRVQRPCDLDGRVVLVDHVGRVQARHLGGDRVDRVLAGLIAERGLDLQGDLGDRVGAHLHRQHEAAVRRLDLVGNVEVLGV